MPVSTYPQHILHNIYIPSRLEPSVPSLHTPFHHSYHFSLENTKAIHVLVGYRCFFFKLCKSFHLPNRAISQQTNVAPPVSMASISARSMGARRNRAGSSLRSKYCPFAGATEPRECPETEPTSPVFARPRGPCCWAVCL
jgi:hypothetical protein